MLIIDPDTTFEATARIDLNGLQADFGIVCKLMHIDELEAKRRLWAGSPAEYANPDSDIANGVAPIKPAVPPSLTDRQWIDTWLVGFGPDVVGKDGHPKPFTPESVTELLNVPGAKRAVINAFLNGYAPAEAKNSVPPPAGS